MWQRRIAAAQFLGIPMTEAEARVCTFAVEAFSDIHRQTVYAPDDADRSPWAHVDLSTVVGAVMEARQVLAEAATPVADEWGRCCWCGVDVSIMWAERGHKWADGSPAALCSDCGPVFDRRGKSAQFWDDQRPGLVEAVTGVPPMMGDHAPAGLLAYAEAVDRGDGIAWSHLPAAAVEALRWDRWARSNGRYAPPEHRAEALARRTATEADRGRRIAQAAADDPYGFTACEGEGEGHE